MSNILRTKQGNLSKVKYFLPAYRNGGEESQSSELLKHNQSKPSRSTQSKKMSANHTHAHKSVHQNQDISFEIVGIHEASVSHEKENHQETKENIINSKHHLDKRLDYLKKDKNGEKTVEASLSSIRALTNSRQWQLPEGSEKQEFYRFIETLKEDETYQHTVTMFTIMYFYQQKRRRGSQRS